MPTTTWIQETVEDRYWEGRDTVTTPRPAPVFPCVVCGVEFDTADLRSWHASETHPLERPVLYIEGRAAPAEVVFRNPLMDGVISVASCSSIRVVRDHRVVDGLEPSELRNLIGGLRSAHLVVELQNHRAVDDANVRATYVLRVAIPDPEELREVDREFVAHLAVDRPSTRDVDAFARAVSGLTSAREYSGGLADYVHGVLVKEGSAHGGATLPFAAFPAKFNRALAELSDHFARPVASAAVGAARLNLNDLVGPIAVTGDDRLDGCSSILHDVANLRPLTSPADREGGLSVVPLCPIDRDTHFVLGAYEALVAHESSTERVAELESRVEDGSLSGPDRSKLRVLLAVALLDAGRHRAQPHLEALAHDEIFRGWAARALERMS